MASQSCTFIIVPDATSQCKRVTISKAVIWGVGLAVLAVSVLVGGGVYMLLSKYHAMSLKVDYLHKLKKVSSAQKSRLAYYEQDITQLSQHLAQIQQLNSRLMVFSGLDPAKDEDGRAMGGADDADAAVENLDRFENGEMLEVEP